MTPKGNSAENGGCIRPDCLHRSGISNGSSHCGWHGQT